MRARSKTVHFAVPGALGQATGGYIYDRCIVDGLRALGRDVTVHELAGSFPCADDAARTAARQALAAADRAVLVIDGLSLPAFSEPLAAGGGTRAIALIHHPLALETGLDPEWRRRFATLEPRLWRAAAGVIVTSAATACDLVASGVGPSRIEVVTPGCGRVVAPPRRARTCTRLLCVATLVPRKGHLTLLRALAGLKRRGWRLECVGGADRHPAHARRVRAAVRLFGLSARVRLRGELAPDRVARAYEAADLFLLPSFHEGYGMAFGEALRHGVPVIGAQAGAVPDVVPRDAGLLARPGDARGLRRAVKRLLAPRARKRRAARARAKARRLPDWELQSRRFAAALERLTP